MVDDRLYPGAGHLMNYIRNINSYYVVSGKIFDFEVSAPITKNNMQRYNSTDYNVMIVVPCLLSCDFQENRFKTFRPPQYQICL